MFRRIKMKDTRRRRAIRCQSAFHQADRPVNPCNKPETQAGNEVQRFQHDMGRSIPEGMFVAVNDPAPVVNTEAACR